MSMSEDRYLSRKEVSKSYRPRSYVMSPGLIRARAPFRFRNALTGLILAGFASAVWAYSILAVKQDDFSDVDAEAREMTMTIGKAMEASTAPTQTKSKTEWSAGSGSGSGSNPSSSLGSDKHVRVDGISRSLSRPRGILAPALDRAFPHLLDPVGKTLVWGAPPLDDLGWVRLRGATSTTTESRR